MIVINATATLCSVFLFFVLTNTHCVGSQLHLKWTLSSSFSLSLPSTFLFVIRNWSSLQWYSHIYLKWINGNCNSESLWALWHFNSMATAMGCQWLVLSSFYYSISSSCFRLHLLKIVIFIIVVLGIMVVALLFLMRLSFLEYCATYLSPSSSPSSFFSYLNKCLYFVTILLIVVTVLVVVKANVLSLHRSCLACPLEMFMTL